MKKQHAMNGTTSGRKLKGGEKKTRRERKRKPGEGNLNGNGGSAKKQKNDNNKERNNTMTRLNEKCSVIAAILAISTVSGS